MREELHVVTALFDNSESIDFALLFLLLSPEQKEKLD